MQNYTKQELRERTLNLLRNQEEDKRLSKSSVILHKLLELSEFIEAQTILFYASFDGEVNTFEMIKRSISLGKTIALPKVDKNSRTMTPFKVEDFEALPSGAYGIKEPTFEERNVLDIDQIDLVVVPGVAFDKDFYRLGRGAGYYDRFLATLNSRTVSVGLAFDFQVIDSLPDRAEHDIPVQILISN